MRRWLFLVVIVLLIADASGVTAFVEPENCGVDVATDRGQETPCPGFCVRCSCCNGPVVHAVRLVLTSSIPPIANAPSPLDPHVSSGVGPEILHVPKALLA
jgi:hypothetical protein